MFDNYVDRKGTHSVKVNDSIKETGSIDAISLSVADMDFRTSPEVVNAIVSMGNHGIYGYTGLSEDYNKTVSNWVKSQYRYTIEEDWIVFCPRIIQAISMIIHSETSVGDNVGIMTPLYSPITNAIITNNRNVKASPLVYRNNTYEIDFENLEAVFESEIKLFILVSPHNPTGRVWTKDEIKKLVDLCKTYNVKLISDEVHADFIWESTFTSVGHYFTEFDQVYVCVSPSKTFNFPGLEVSNIIIPNQGLRSRFQDCLTRLGFHNPNFFAESALQAAYNESGEWFKLMKESVQSNRQYAIDFISEKFPSFDVVQSEGTYLLWINYKRAGITEADLQDWLVNKAKITVSTGSSFGAEGEGFFRINIGLPRQQLEIALNKMYETYQALFIN